MNIDFVFDNEVENFENNYEQDFTAIIEQALKTLGIEDDVEVSCVLVDDERIHEINREYRHIDRSTDVISFAMEDNDQFYVEGMPRTLGDIFISVDHAKKQAEADLLQAKEEGEVLKKQASEKTEQETEALKALAQGKEEEAVSAVIKALL